MLPLRDNITTRGRPWMMYFILATNVAVFIYQVGLPLPDLYRLVEIYGVVPTRIDNPFLLLFPSQWATLIPLVTSQFLHGGWVHLGGNMLYLWIFGDDVECTMGSIRFLVFYVLAGIAGNLAHVMMNLGSSTPTIGASGAVAGVLGAYLMSFPYARVLTLVPLGFFLTVVEIPAVLFLGFWFLLQLVSGLSVVVAGADSVAWWAHIGGFAAGMLLIFWFRRSTRRTGRYAGVGVAGRRSGRGTYHGPRYR